MSPGTNGPFWSLGLEATYYMVFGFFLMSRKWLAAAISIIVLFLAGYITTRLFPCWLLGVALYHLNKKTLVGEWIGVGLFLVSLVAIARVGWLRHSVQFADSHQFSLRYVEAMLFGVNIFAAASASPLIERIPGKLGPLIHWLGGMTFALYLCHRPLLQFLSSERLGLPGSVLQQVWLFGLIAVVTVAVASFGEWFRKIIRRMLAKLWIEPAALRPVAGQHNI
jgi:peptidoglycan/LPS O-acetylase OafA/YrhL